MIRSHAAKVKNTAKQKQRELFFHFSHSGIRANSRENKEFTNIAELSEFAHARPNNHRAEREDGPALQPVGRTFATAALILTNNASGDSSTVELNTAAGRPAGKVNNITC